MLLIPEKQREIYASGARDFMYSHNVSGDYNYPGHLYIAFRTEDSLVYIFSYTNTRIYRIAKKVNKAGGVYRIQRMPRNGEVYDFTGAEDLRTSPAKVEHWGDLVGDT